MNLEAPMLEAIDGILVTPMADDGVKEFCELGGFGLEVDTQLSFKLIALGVARQPFELCRHLFHLGFLRILIYFSKTSSGCFFA